MQFSLLVTTVLYYISSISSTVTEQVKRDSRLEVVSNVALAYLATGNKIELTECCFDRVSS